MSSLENEITDRLTALANGEADVEETARWAVSVMEADDPVWRAEAVWRVLDKLAGAAAQAPAPDEFRAWSREFAEELAEEYPQEAPEA